MFTYGQSNMMIESSNQTCIFEGRARVRKSMEMVPPIEAINHRVLS